jgi:hypothetical protein
MIQQKLFFHIHEPRHMPVGIKYDNIQNIDKYDSKSLDYIMIGDILDYYDPQYTEGLLGLISDKLNNGGHIEIQAPDISELCISSASNQIDIQTIKSIIYGRKYIHTIYDIENLLKSKYNIYQKRYINIFEYYILAQKNEE